MAIQVPKTVAQLIRADAPASAARTALGLGSVATHDASEFAAAAGSTSIVTVGTVTAGTWHGSTIGVAYGGTGLATVASGKLLYASALDTLAALNLDASLGISGGTLSVQANTVNQKVIVSRAGTTIGTRKQINLIEGSNVTLTVADNSGSDRVDVTVAAAGGGGLTVGGAVSGGGASRVLYEDASQNLAASANLSFNGTSLDVSTNPLKFGSAFSITQAGNGWTLANTANDLVDVTFNTSATGANLRYENRGGLLIDGGLPELQLGVGGAASPLRVNRDRVQVSCRAGTILPLTVKGQTSQSENLTEWQNDSAGVHGTVSENGYFTTRKNSAPADAELASGEAAWWFDSTNGSAKLMVKAKQANSTVVTGSITLA